jgi:hypothetical protein
VIEITIEGDDPHLTHLGAAIHRLLETNGITATLTVEHMTAQPNTPVKLSEFPIGTTEIKVFNPEKEL